MHYVFSNKMQLDQHTALCQDSCHYLTTMKDNEAISQQ